MEKIRSSSSSSKHLKKRPKKSSKKSKRHRRSSYDDDDSSSKYKNSRTSKESFKIVEYSDVSSEDFSAPEAGEIQDEENSRSLSDRELVNSSVATMKKINNGNGCHDLSVFKFIFESMRRKRKTSTKLIVRHISVFSFFFEIQV